MSNYIKLDGTNIIGHCRTTHPGANPDDYDATVAEDNIFSGGVYLFGFVDDDLVELTDDERACHPNVKVKLIGGLSQQSFDERRAILPDYKWSNASLGIYEAAVMSSYVNTVNAFRDEYYRAKALIDAADTKAVVDSALAGVNFPSELVPA